MEPQEVKQAELNDLVRFTALLYYHLAKEVVQAFGQEGEKAIARAMENLGQERGMTIKAKVEEEGLPLTLENLARFYDLPLAGAWRTTARISPRRATHMVEYCPFAQVWRQRKAENLGLLYCKVEDALKQAYNPDIVFEQSKSLMAGQDCCLISAKLKEK